MTDLSKSQPTPVRVETSIGALSLFPQRFEDIGAFSKLPPDEPSSSRLRFYLPYIAARSDALIEDGEWPRIDEASSQRLPDEDLERIAEAYLSMPERRRIAEGAGPLSGPIVRADGESATAYLDRLLTADHERQMEDLKGTYESLRDRSGQPLASALADVDRQASSLRDVATSFMQGQDLAEEERRHELDLNAIPNSLEGNPLLSSDAGITENDRLKSAHDEEMALTRSIGIVTTQSAILVASLSETATRFLRQFSETTEKSAEAARTSLRTVLVTVLIMGILAAIAAAAAIVSYFEERENRQTTNQWHESVLRSMKETAAAQEAQIKSLDDKVRELGARQNELAAPLPAPATDGAAQKAASEAEAPIQPSPKPASPKRATKRKTSR